MSNHTALLQTLTPYEQAILNEIQWRFPISADPYGDIAQIVGGTREDVYTTVTDLKRRGIIRRLGGSFAAHQLGYVSVLVACRVEPDHLEAAAAQASIYPEVTHNYERASVYNLWFTVIAENQARMDEILASVRACRGVHAVHALPALRTFKIRVDFQFGKGDGHAG